MQKKFKLVMVLALVCFAAAPALAADTKFGAEVFGAFNSYSMSDVNDHQIKELNDSQNTNFNDVTSGLTGGINARMWANQRWMFSAGWEPLFLETETDANGTSGKINLDGNSFQVTGAYFFPSQSNGRYGIGAGLGLYSISGEASGDASLSSTGSSQDVSGSTVGFHFMGVGEWTVSPGFAITAASGYRIAKIDDTKFDDKSYGTYPTSTQEKLATDYSGFVGRVGLSFYLPTSSKQ